jgi:hypothetical protein
MMISLSYLYYLVINHDTIIIAMYFTIETNLILVNQDLVLSEMHYLNLDIAKVYALYPDSDLKRYFQDVSVEILMR